MALVHTFWVSIASAGEARPHPCGSCTDHGVCDGMLRRGASAQAASAEAYGSNGNGDVSLRPAVSRFLAGKQVRFEMNFTVIPADIPNLSISVHVGFITVGE